MGWINADIAYQAHFIHRADIHTTQYIIDARKAICVKQTFQTRKRPPLAMCRKRLISRERKRWRASLLQFFLPFFLSRASNHICFYVC